MVADNPDQKIELKAFQCEILNGHDALKKKESGYEDIPVIRQLGNAIVQRNYDQIRQDVQEIVQSEMGKLLNDPELVHMILRK